MTTSIRTPNLGSQINLDPSLLAAQALRPALNDLPVPSIGTKGLEFYIYDESQLLVMFYSKVLVNRLNLQK